METQEQVQEQETPAVEEPAQQDTEKSEKIGEEQPTTPDNPDEMVLFVGDEEAAPEDSQAAPDWVRDVRQQNLELKQEIQELRAKNQPAEDSQTGAIGKEPTLEDHEYDSTAYRDALLSWNSQKIQQDNLIASNQKKQQQAQDEWNSVLKGYVGHKSGLKLTDFDDVEAVAQQHLSQMQLGIILQGADNPAKVVYAIGKDAKRAKAMAAISDPVKFAVAMAKLETTVKMQKRKILPSPERIPSGSSVKIQSSDKKLDQLMADADKTGDRTKVVAYKRELKRNE